MFLYTVQFIYNFTHVWNFRHGAMQHHGACHGTLLCDLHQVCCMALTGCNAWSLCHTWLSTTCVCVNHKLYSSYIYSTVLYGWDEASNVSWIQRSSKLQITKVSFEALYCTHTVDLHCTNKFCYLYCSCLLVIDLRVPYPLLNHRSLACYCSCSLTIPYNVIDNAWKRPFSHCLVFTYA